MSAHTPGPWRVKGWSGQEAFVTAKNPDDPTKDMHVTMTCMRSDAKLIAASPIMLTALEEALPWLGGLANENQSATPAYLAVRKALYAARGEVA